MPGGGCRIDDPGRAPVVGRRPACDGGLFLEREPSNDIRTEPVIKLDKHSALSRQDQNW